MSLNVTEFAPLLLLIVMSAAIAVLCYVWMKKSRASQGRMEQHQQEMISLLREQNELLRKLVGEQTH
jgi:hypothetical protein